MKRIKNLTFGILGATILSLGLYACSNDDSTSSSNTNEQSNLAAKGFSDLKIIPSLPGFGLVSSYAGPCVSAQGFCIERVNPGTGPVFGIGKLDNSTVRLTMSMETYQKNKEYLTDNIFEVVDEFSLNQEISIELGFETETFVTKQVAEVIQADSEFFYIDLNIREKIIFDINNLTEVHNEGNVQILMAHTIGENENDVIKYGMFLIKKNGVVIDEYIVKTDESNPQLKKLNFMESDFSNFLSFDFNLQSESIEVTNKKNRKKDGCGQAVMDCIQDVYSNHGWASVAAWVTTAFIPETALIFAGACYDRNC